MPIKILHTSDWHLGKKLFREQRYPEQEQFLTWLVAYIREYKVDILVVAGDIFDVPYPPTEALRLYYNFLKKVSQLEHCHVLVLGGNHDSGRLLDAPAAVLKGHRVHVFGRPRPQLSDNIFSFKKAGEQVDFFHLPYFRSFEIFELLKQIETTDAEVVSEENSEDIIGPLSLILKCALKNMRPSARKVLVGHHLFGAYELAGSEQGLGLSGAETIPLSALAGWDYVALGHIHNPQCLRKEAPMTYYSGAPIPLRFSEHNNKSVRLITIDGGKTEVKTEILPKFRELISIKIDSQNWQEELEQRLARVESDSLLLPFLEVKLTLSAPSAGIMDEVKQICESFPLQLLHCAIEIRGIRQQPENTSFTIPSTEELFSEYYRQKYPEEEKIPQEILYTFHEIMNEARLYGHDAGEEEQ